MLETEIDKSPMKNSSEDRNFIVQEYESIVESLQQELKNCKDQQNNLRSGLESLKDEHKKAAEVAREAFSHANCIDCPGNMYDRESVENLKKQIAIIQLEKDSMFQLWQISLKAVNTLEEEIKISQRNGISNTYYDEQVNSVKKLYSEAIKALEAKLYQTKENFTKHQALWDSSRESIEQLNREKNDLEKTIGNLRNELTKEEKSKQEIIATLKSDLENTRRELEACKNSLPKLENDLLEARTLATKMIAKDQESKNKVAEAIELIETAMKEKEIIMQREARIIDEKSKLEANLTDLAESFSNRLEKEIAKMKEKNEKNVQEYILEIKELKAEIREKTTILERTQREYRLIEEEMEKMRHSSDDFNNRSGIKVIELEKKIQDANEKLENCEEACRRKFQEALCNSDHRISELEERLASANERMKRNHDQTAREIEDRLTEADEKTKEAVNKYCLLEKRLSRALDERENVSSELRSLQITFDREISRRESERRLLESRIRELQGDLKNANEASDKTVLRANLLAAQLEKLERENFEKKTHIMSERNQSVNLEETLNRKKIQDKYEQKLFELGKHVKVHQELSSRWKEEAESLATKFQARYKELHMKVSTLQTENEELNKELLSCRQQVALCRAQVMQRSRYDPHDDIG